MRHRKHKFKIGRTSSHRRCMIANMLKSLIEHEKIQTTVTKAKELRRHADRMITLAKRNTLATRRKAIAELMVRFNPLTAKEARLARSGKAAQVYNSDRIIIQKLFNDLAVRFSERSGGYTRIIKIRERVGDHAEICLIEYLRETA